MTYALIGLLAGAAVVGAAYLLRRRYPWVWAALAVVLGLAAGLLPLLLRRRTPSTTTTVERTLEAGAVAAEAVRREAEVAATEARAEVTAALAAPSPADEMARLHNERRGR